MTTFIARVSRRGQITIPVALRKALGIETPGRVRFTVDDAGVVMLSPVTSNARSLAGTIRHVTGKDPGDFEAMIEEAMEEMAEREVAKLRQQGSQLFFGRSVDSPEQPA